MTMHWMRAATALATVTLATGCGGGESGPNQSPLAIAKAPTKSGDGQTGLVSLPLGNDLQVLVTRDGEPVPEVTVAWATGDGSVTPTSSKTDAQGVAASAWTLGATAGQQTATADVAGATGSPITFTATGIENPFVPGPTISVLSEGGNRFDPATVTVVVGTMVTWEWAETAVGHNIVPDNGETPSASGPLVDGPHTYTFTFNTPGVYHYHCAAHGAAGGVGMSGTVTVTAEAP